MKQILFISILLAFSFSYGATYTSTGVGTWDIVPPATIGVNDNVTVSHGGMSVVLPLFYAGTMTLTAGELTISSVAILTNGETLNMSGGTLKVVGGGAAAFNNTTGSWNVSGGILDFSAMGSLTVQSNITGIVDNVICAAGNTALNFINGGSVFSAGPCGPIKVAFGVGLPIELLSFSGVYSNESNATQLSWTTVSETNNSYFIIEKANASNEFIAIEALTGAGTSNELLHYNLLDYNPEDGVSYYRLVQYDYDGTSTKSKVIAVDITKSEINIYPNPAKVSLFIDLPQVATESSSLLSVIDVTGKVMHSKSITNVHTVFDTRLLKSGVYVFQIKLNTEVIRKKIVITH